MSEIDSASAVMVSLPKVALKPAHVTYRNWLAGGLAAVFLGLPALAYVVGIIPWDAMLQMALSPIRWVQACLTQQSAQPYMVLQLVLLSLLLTTIASVVEYKKVIALQIHTSDVAKLVALKARGKSFLIAAYVVGAVWLILTAVSFSLGPNLTEIWKLAEVGTFSGYQLMLSIVFNALMIGAAGLVVFIHFIIGLTFIDFD